MKYLRIVLILMPLILSGCFAPKRVVNKKDSTSTGAPYDPADPTRPTGNNGNNDNNDGNGDGDGDEDDSSETTNTLPEPGTTSTTGSSTTNCYAGGVVTSPHEIEDYYKLLGVRGIGNGLGAYTWSSDTYFANSQDEEGIFSSDRRVHLRILVKAAPGIGGQCRRTASYGKLSLDLDIRGKSATSAHERLQFNEIKVGECSEVLRFVNIPQNSESSPFVIKINNVMWDYDCTFDPVGTANCNTQPLKSVWNNHCWEIELHVATDITHDIPR